MCPVSYSTHLPPIENLALLRREKRPDLSAHGIRDGAHPREILSHDRIGSRDVAPENLIYLALLMQSQMQPFAQVWRKPDPSGTGRPRYHHFTATILSTATDAPARRRQR